MKKLNKLKSKNSERLAFGLNLKVQPLLFGRGDIVHVWEAVEVPKNNCVGSVIQSRGWVSIHSQCLRMATAFHQTPGEAVWPGPSDI